MTHEYQTGRPSSSEGSAKDAARDTAQTAKDDASGLAKSAAESGQHLAKEAKEQARQLTDEAKGQVQDLFRQGLSQATQQVASSQREKLAGGLRTFGEDMRSMAEGNGPSEPGLASDLAREVAARVESVADWFEHREPSDVVDEVKRFARRRPGTFLAIAAGTGLLIGRVTRSGKDVHDQEQGGQQQGGSSGGTPTRTSAYGAAGAPTTSTYGTGPTYGGTTSTGTGAAYAAGVTGAAGTSAGAPTSGLDVGPGTGTDPYATGTTDTGGTTAGYGTDRVQDTYGAGTQNPPSGAGTFTTDTYGSDTYGTPGDEDAGVFGGGTGEVPEREAGTTDRPWSPVHGEEGQR